jgi:hypothetical protein
MSDHGDLVRVEMTFADGYKQELVGAEAQAWLADCNGAAEMGRIHGRGMFHHEWREVPASVPPATQYPRCPHFGGGCWGPYWPCTRPAATACQWQIPECCPSTFGEALPNCPRTGTGARCSGNPHDCEQEPDECGRLVKVGEKT